MNVPVLIQTRDRAARGRLGSARVVLGVNVQGRVTNRPRWSRATPDELVTFVEPGVAGNAVPRLPARAGLGAPPPLHRLFGVYEAVCACRIPYADEPWPDPDGWCEIRPPAKVLSTAEPANALDLAVAFAAACLDAGLHPVVALLDPAGGGQARSVVVVRVSRAWVGAEDGAARPVVLPVAPDWPGGLRARLDAPGAYVAVDVTRATSGGGSDGGPAPFAEAVAAGAALLADPALGWGVGVDIGLAYHPRDWPPSPYAPMAGR
jgi:hypothetical protein